MTLVRKKKSSGDLWYLYILQCRDNSLYTGITKNLERRVLQHNIGRASRYTRSRLPVVLAYHERCRGRSSALKKEYAMKLCSRKEKLEYISRKANAL